MKIGSRIRTAAAHRYEQKIQQALSEYLFSDVEEIDPASDPQRYEKVLLPLLERLRQSTISNVTFSRRIRRQVMLSVMLDVSKNLSGETVGRLRLAFQRLGFVDDEVKNAHSAHWWIRADACRNLQIMYAENALDILSTLLDDENEDVRIESAQSMVDIAGVEALSPILLTIDDITPWMEIRLSKSVLHFGSSAVSHLAKGMKSKSNRVQRFCVEMMGSIGDVYAVPIILEYIDYEVLEVQCESLIALGKLGDERATPIILRYLKSKNEPIRIAAAAALGKLSSPATVDALNGLLLHDTLQVRLAAAEALTQLGGIGARTLIYSTHTDDPETKLVAYQFLDELGYCVTSERTT